MEKIKIDIVSGFLGAGKTSFINYFLSTNLVHKEKIIILENEFGTAKLNELVLGEENLTAISLMAGCICCNNLYSFQEKLLEIKENYAPDRIILEPNGLAKLSEIKNVFSEPDICDSFEIDHEIIIVDAANYWKRKLISDIFFKEQLRAGKTVFFSKCQSLSSEACELIMEDVQCINPALQIIAKDWMQMGEAEFQLIWEESRHRHRIITFRQKSSHSQLNDLTSKKIIPIFQI